jgi:type III restriction enzyme
MKLKFKTQAYQTAAVQAVVDCFKGQPPASAEAISYRIDPGKPRKARKTCLPRSAASRTPTWR